MGDRFTGDGPGNTPPNVGAWDSDARRQADPNISRILAIKAWDDEPIPTAVNFFTIESTNIALPGLAQIATSLAGGGAIQIPENNIAALKAVVFFLSGPTTATDVTFTVRANQIGIRGLNNVKIPPQNAGAVNYPISGTWDIPSGALIDVLITNNGAGAELVNATMVGWYNSAQDAYRWTGHMPGQIGGG